MGKMQDSMLLQHGFPDFSDLQADSELQSERYLAERKAREEIKIRNDLIRQKKARNSLAFLHVQKYVEVLKVACGFAHRERTRCRSMLCLTSGPRGRDQRAAVARLSCSGLELFPPLEQTVARKKLIASYDFDRYIYGCNAKRIINHISRYKGLLCDVNAHISKDQLRR